MQLPAVDLKSPEVPQESPQPQDIATELPIIETVAKKSRNRQDGPVAGVDCFDI